MVFNSPGASGLVRYRTIILIIRSANQCGKPLTFSIVFSTPQTLRSASRSSLHPPPLSSINRITIRLPSRFSAKLDNSHYSQLSLSGSMRPPLGCIHAAQRKTPRGLLHHDMGVMMEELRGGGICPHRGFKRKRYAAKTVHPKALYSKGSSTHPRPLSRSPRSGSSYHRFCGSSLQNCEAPGRRKCCLSDARKRQPAGNLKRSRLCILPHFLQQDG